jgi:RNA polymerase sigma factor
MESSVLPRIDIAKDNNKELNILVNDYKPFIASCVCEFVGRSVEYGRDDELSIAMLAFTEAVKSYSEGKGAFFTFARGVINRRLIDYMRQQKKYKNEISTSYSVSKNYSEQEDIDLSLEESIRRYSISEYEMERRFELEELKKELDGWGMNFFEVARSSPKHKSTKTIYLEAIKYIMQDEEIKKVMNEKKYFPIKSISDKLKINKKKLERGRSYIIAGFLIMQGEYENIRDFINWR